MFIDKKNSKFPSGHIYMKDVECDKRNEKSISIIFAIFSLWDMVVFVLKIDQFFDEFLVQNQP